MLTPFNLIKTPSPAFDSPFSLKRSFSVIGKEIFLQTPDSSQTVAEYAATAADKVRMIRNATLGLYDSTIVGQIDKTVHDPKNPVSDSNPFIVPTMITDSLIKAARTIGQVSRSMDDKLDSQVNVAPYIAAVELVMAFDFMNAAALDRSKPFACHRIALIRLAKKGRVSIERVSTSRKYDSWKVENPREAVVDVGFDAMTDFSVPDFSKTSRNSITLGFFDLTPIDLFENFKWLSGGKEDWAKTFVKAHGAWFGHCSFAMQYLHTLVRDVRVTANRTGFWRPKVMPKDWITPGRFAVVPIRNLPEAKIWFGEPRLFETNAILTTQTRDDRTLLGSLQSTVRPLTQAFSLTDVLRGLPALSVSDCIELTQRIDFSSYLHQALVTTWRQGSKPSDYEPNDVAAYNRATKASLDLVVTAALGNMLAMRRGKRQLPFGSFVRSTGQSIFVDFKKTI